ncbi:MAG: DnaB-like helicase C-terminal domain-containing protein [Bacillota bacterium]
MNYGELLLSKIVENDSAHILKKLRIDGSHFATSAERQVYQFIQQYAERNNGAVPSPTLLASETEFEYIPGVSDSYDYLSKQLKDYSAKKKITNLIEDQAGEVFDSYNGIEFVSWVKDNAERIIRESSTIEAFGTDLKNEREKFLEEYRKRKSGESNRIWPSKFATINTAVGGHSVGSLVTIFGRSGKGKSVVGIEEIIEVAMNGGNVIIWSLEMGWFEMMVRIFSSVSGRLGLFKVQHGDSSYDGGFEQRSLNQGTLSDEFEEAFELFLANIDKYISGSITLRCVDDTDFYQRDCDQLEADILATKEKYGSCDAVLIDPIYLMDYEKTFSRTAGAEVQATSQRLRRIAGQSQVIMFLITQADEDKTIEDKDGKQKEIRIPARASLKKSKAILEDSSLVIGMDSLDGRALFSLSKSRTGGNETQAELLFLPGYGLVREFSQEEIDYSQFNDTF